MIAIRSSILEQADFYAFIAISSTLAVPLLSKDELFTIRFIFGVGGDSNFLIVGVYLYLFSISYQLNKVEAWSSLHQICFESTSLWPFAHLF